MKKIAIDVMGGDNGIQAVIEAAVEFQEKRLDYKFILVGDKVLINKYVKETERIQIIDVPKTVDKTLGARAARNGDNSMSHAIEIVKDKKADAVLSSGDSGIYLSMATLMLRRMKGIKRPAFMPIFPTIKKDKKFVMLDVGANVDTTSEMLVQWAKIGDSFSKAALRVVNPKVAILNIGTELNKGKAFHKEAHEILKNDKTLNFCGYVESRDLLYGEYDVVVSDGYAGNMVLKTMEGTVLSLLSLIKSTIKSKARYKIGGLLTKNAFREVAKSLDYRNVGAAWVIGLNGLVIKAHGSSDKKAFKGALEQISMALETNAFEKLGEAFND